MSLDNSTVVPALATGGYTIDQSLRFEADDSSYLSQTFSSGSTTQWTWSAWVKRTEQVYGDRIFACAPGSADSAVRWNYGAFNFQYYNGSTTVVNLVTTAEYRDPSAWYHIVLIYDSANSTSTDRVRIYVNGTRVTEFSSATYPSSSLSTNINSANTHYFGRAGQANSSHFSGYLAEVNFIDGQALDPTNFGETGDYGEWRPIEYTGTYGTNGFYLDFDGTYYNDKSGNGNNWTANNLSTTDVVLDSPTNNFCTLNSIATDPSAYDQPTFLQGNLVVGTNGNSNSFALGTMSFTSGKWYFEQVVKSSNGGFIGITDVTANQFDGSHLYDGGSNPDGWGYYKDGRTQRDNVYTSYGDSFTTDDIVMCAFDMDNGKVWFGKNGTWQNSGNPASGTNAAFTNVTNEVTPRCGHYNSDAPDYMNFGQDSSFAGQKTAQGNSDDNGYGDFYYTPPSGFLALCTANLSDPDVIPSENFNTVLYSGTGSTNGVSGVGFQPDFVWIKRRNAAYSHRLLDVLRGTNSQLMSNTTEAEESATSFSSFDSDGFTVTSSDNSYNSSSGTYVAWNWKANGSGSSNTNGDITSTVSVNQAAGFSIGTYTGTGVQDASVGHGLGARPDFLMIKQRNGSNIWMTTHSALSYTTSIDLDSTTVRTGIDYFGDTDMDSSVFHTDTGNSNISSGTFVFYAWKSVEGFSKFGSYIGNSVNDKPFIYTGFKPAFIMLKNATSSGSNWALHDSKRSPYNPTNSALLPDGDYQESTGTGRNVDFFSNGFKIRTYSNDYIGGTNRKYMYIAFAETPFKYATAR